MAIPIPHYVVFSEHTLGYMYDEQPNQVWILASSVIRGAVQSWKDGSTMALPNDPRLRPATLKDFDTYRVVPPPNFTEK